LKAKEVAFIGAFSALAWALASLNKLLPKGVGHVTLDAVFITFLLLLAVQLTGRIGVATAIGFITGLLMPLLGAKPIALVSWSIRGLVIDLVLLATHHKACCLKCCSLAASLGFLAQTLIGNALNIFLFVNPRAWMMVLTFAVTIALIGSATSIIGAYLIIKLAPRIKQAVGVEA